MITKKYDGTDVRKILTGMIMDHTVCARISSRWEDAGLFSASWSNLIGGVIVRYFRKYNSPPKQQMTTLFEEWAKETMASDEVVQSVERFLQGMSDEEHQDAPEYIIELAGRHFNKVRMEQTIEAAKADLENWDVDGAQKRFDTYNRVNLGAGSVSTPMKDISLWAEAWDYEKHQPLVYYRGELGKFIGDAFQRGRLFSFMAPDKTGKTTWLVDFVYRALRNRNRVAYFDLGDALESEFMRRLTCRIVGCPQVDSTCLLPVGWNEDGSAKYEERALKTASYVDSFRELLHVSGNEENLKTSFHPSSSLSAAGVDGILSDLDREEDWRADICVIDYSDLLSPPPGIKDTLDQIDETWKRLRRISQQRHCLVVTATQASAAAYGREDGLLSRKHFSGRKTKLAHVNGMLGINVSADDKEKGLSRINWIVRREGAYSEKAFVTVAGCMEIGNPAILSKR